MGVREKDSWPCTTMQVWITPFMEMYSRIQLNILTAKFTIFRATKRQILLFEQVGMQACKEDQYLLAWEFCTELTMCWNTEYGGVLDNTISPQPLHI